MKAFSKSVVSSLLLGLGLAVAGSVAMAQTGTMAVGAARLHTAPKGGDEPLPNAPFRTDRMLERAAPTSQWYSTLIFSDKPKPIYAQPLSVRPGAQGLELCLPLKEVRATPRLDTEIAYPHRDPIVLSSTAFELGAAKLAQADDWSFAMTMGSAGDELRATVAHGSPYVPLMLTRGDLRLRMPQAGERFDSGDDPRRLAIRVMGRHYAFFLPSGGNWQQISPREWVGRMPSDRRYATAAVLPDASPASLDLISRHAYVHTVSTRVQWRFDEAHSRVHTTFTAETVVREGPDAGPLYGLYPHHWHGNSTVLGKLGPAFSTVRGPIRLLADKNFSTSHPFFGFVPQLPRLEREEDRGRLADTLKSDVRNARRMMLPEGESAYWQGKGFQRILKLLDVVDQEGPTEAGTALLEGIKRRMEEWFLGEDRKRYFFLDQRLGVMATHPNEFHAVEEINDQHFWFGYWIRAAAEVAMRDPAWAAPSRWGSVIDLMVANIANADRNRRDLPFLRTFDPYEGHSWANGLGGVGPWGELGNNQESSSEALNAWAGLLLWAEFKNDHSLRELAAYLYATEWQAVEHYWFDVHRIVFAPEYRNVDVAMVFGGAYAHNTWWTDEPRQITGINLLPITTSSTGLARHPDYIRRNLAALKDEQALAASRGKRGKPPDIWQDIFAKYQALVDPQAALQSWDRWGAVELGETRTATLHWLLSLQALGTPDFSVTADHALHAVFRRADGRRTYLAYNAGHSPRQVRFSDGMTLTVEPGRLARSAATGGAN